MCVLYIGAAAISKNPGLHSKLCRFPAALSAAVHFFDVSNQSELRPKDAAEAIFSAVALWECFIYLF